MPDALIHEARWIFIARKCGFDKPRFCIYLKIRVGDGTGAMKGIHQISLVTKGAKLENFLR